LVPPLLVCLFDNAFCRAFFNFGMSGDYEPVSVFAFPYFMGAALADHGGSFFFDGFQQFLSLHLFSFCLILIYTYV